MQVDHDVANLLSEFGLLKAKAGGGGGAGKLPARAGPQQLPARLAVSLLSGEAVAELLNAIFTKHAIKQRVSPSNVGEHMWRQVARGLLQFSVELDDETLSALENGDAALIAELLGEFNIVYRHWATKHEKKPRRTPGRRSQPQQGAGGYAGRQMPASAAPARRPPLLPSGSGAAASSPTGGGGVAEVADSDAQAAQEESEIEDRGHVSDEHSGDMDDPYAAQEESYEEPHDMMDAAPVSGVGAGAGGGYAGGGGARNVMRAEQGPRSRNSVPPRAFEDEDEDAFHGDMLGHEVPRRKRGPARHLQPFEVSEQPLDAEVLPEEDFVSIPVLLEQLWPGRELESARTAPELLGLSMLGPLRISGSQAVSLLKNDGRRLANAFLEGDERNTKYLQSWLQSLSVYAGALTELLIMHPQHAMFTLTVVMHGLQSPSPDNAKKACEILDCLASGLVRAGKSNVVSQWFAQSGALADLAELLRARPEARTAAASLVLSASGHELFTVLSKHLKRASLSMQDFFSLAHLLLRSLLDTLDAREQCKSQGILRHFLHRSLRCLNDAACGPPALQAAAVLATDVWLESSVALKPGQAIASPVSELLAALDKATNSESRLLQRVAFSCMFRLLHELCLRSDSENAPTVYRALVYAMFGAHGQWLREYVLRTLASMLPQHSGMPVGMLVEPMLKQLQDSSTEAVSIVELDVFSAIASHERCSPRHAALLAQVLGRLAMESRPSGRAATVPLLLVMERFAGAPELLDASDQLIKVALTRLINRETPRYQLVRIRELLAKMVCLDKCAPLQNQVRDLVMDISRAYLMSFAALHPNLQEFVEMWSDNAAQLEKWVQQQFHDESGDHTGGSESDEDLGNEGDLEMQSVARSHGSTVQSEIKVPASARVLADRATSPIAIGASHLAPPSEIAASESDVQVQELADEAAGLRAELEAAKQHQEAARAESAALRAELMEVRQLHERVRNEVADLQRRRDQLVQAKSAHPAAIGGHAQAKARPPLQRPQSLPHQPPQSQWLPQPQQPQQPQQQQHFPPGRQSQHHHQPQQQDVPIAHPPGHSVHPAPKPKQRAGARPQPQDDGAEAAQIEQADGLLQAFRGPLQVMYAMYMQTVASAEGPRKALPVESVNKCLKDNGVVPDKIQAKDIFKIIRTTKLGKEGALSVDDFLVLLRQVALRERQKPIVVPFEDFGVPVPLDTMAEPALRVQSLLQHLMRKADGPRTSRLRNAFGQALRHWVLDYATGQLDFLNSQLQLGEEIAEESLPEGFEVISEPMPVVYTVPEGIPVSTAETIAVEILDDVLSEVFGIHFLEASPSEPVANHVAIVKGYPDLSSLRDAQ